MVVLQIKKGRLHVGCTSVGDTTAAVVKTNAMFE